MLWLGATSFDPSDLMLALVGAVAGAFGTAILWLGAQAWRQRRPIVVPTQWAAPFFGFFLLFESLLGSELEKIQWGSAYNWPFLGMAIAGFVFVIALTWWSASRSLYVGGLTMERGQQLARAAMQAVAPGSRILGTGAGQRIGKEGPGLQLREQKLVGIVVFKSHGALPAATRRELFQGIVRCLGSEKLELRPGVALPVFAFGFLMVAIGLGVAVAMALRDA